MRITAQLMLLMLIAAVANAQTIKTSRFNIGLNYQPTVILDQQASPLQYRSAQKSLLLAYLNIKPKGMFYTKIDAGFGNLRPIAFKNRQWYNPSYNDDGTPKADSLRLTGKLYTGRLRVGYNRRVLDRGFSIGSQSIKNKMMVGGSINDQFFYSDNITRVAWFNTLSANLDLAYSLVMEKRHSLHLNLSVPLIALNSRLPYHNTISSSEGRSGLRTFLAQGSHLALPDNFQSIQLGGLYEYDLNNRFALGLQYSFQWQRYKKEQPLKMLQNTIGIIFIFK